VRHQVAAVATKRSGSKNKRLLDFLLSYNKEVCIFVNNSFELHTTRDLVHVYLPEKNIILIVKGIRKMLFILFST
jgi:hypothetical protein